MARASISPDYLAAGGIEAIDGQGASDEIAAAFTASGLDLAIICGSDKLYEAEGAAMAAALGGADWLGLAGRPPTPMSCERPELKRLFTRAMIVWPLCGRSTPN